MVAVFFLKMLWDAAVYYLFAAPVAAYFGCGDLMPWMVLQCLIYAVSRLPKNRLLRLVFLLPMAVCYLPQNTLAGYIALAPVTLYALWMSVADRPVPSLPDQRQHLEDFWKPLSLGVILSLCFQQFAVLLPFALTALFSAVILLRILRHGPQVYSQPKFHCVNLLSVGIVPAVACLLGSNTVVTGIKEILTPIYRHVLMPLVILLAWIPLMLLQWLLDLFIPNSVQEMEHAELTKGVEDIQEVVQDFAWAEILLWCVVAVTGICLAVFLLRKVRAATVPTEAPPEYQTTYESPWYDAAVSQQDAPNIRSIRRYYRRFLKLCQKHGLHRKESSTSAEIDSHAKQLPGIGRESSQIRSLYIRARYGGHTTPEDISQMRRLLTAVKKDAKNGR